MMKIVLGIRVKSGWASAVVVGTERGPARYLHRARLLLCDPKVPQSSQPFHRGSGRLQTGDAVLRRLTDIVYASAARSLGALVQDCTTSGHRPTAVALVVGSTIDPTRVANEHIRAHASEAQLFRTALERAAAGLGLACSVTRERDLGALVAAALGPSASATVAGFAEVAGRPWRADEKLATLAAWVALA